MVRLNKLIIMKELFFKIAIIALCISLYYLGYLLLNELYLDQATAMALISFSSGIVSLIAFRLYYYVKRQEEIELDFKEYINNKSNEK